MGGIVLIELERLGIQGVFLDVVLYFVEDFQILEVGEGLRVARKLVVDLELATQGR